MVGKKARPQTHSDDAGGRPVGSEAEAARAVAKARDGDVPKQGPYYRGWFMGAELHWCPYCDETAQTHDQIAAHIERVHVKPPAPPAADRAAAAGIILPPDSE